MLHLNKTGLRLERLPDDASEAGDEARAFCLSVIKEFYGYDYRPDWHRDLDALRSEASLNWFNRANGGAFWILRQQSQRIVASAAIHDLQYKPDLRERLSNRYARNIRIPQLARVYVRPELRRSGLGGKLAQVAEAVAREMGYTTLYLHASAEALPTLAFWEAQGYRQFDRAIHRAANGDAVWSIDFDKQLRPS